MASVNVTAGDRERIARARALGRALAQSPSAVVHASYDSDRDAVHLEFRGGGSMTIPRRLIPGLARVRSASRLSALSVSPAGDAISWRPLDIDVYVPGLIERAFGTHALAAASGQRGGRRRTKAKRAAARLNGAKGGRPRKTMPV